MAFDLLLGINNLSLAQDSIVFTCSLEKTEQQAIAALNLYKEAFHALGKDFSMRYVALPRAIASEKSGQSDGDCGRFQGFIERSGLSSMIRVDVPIARIDAQV